jgi:dihydrofolate reductase
MAAVHYEVAMSLDGYIAGPDGEYDWIVQDPDIDFAEMFARFDMFWMGRRTFEMMVEAGRGEIPGKRIVVFSRTLRQRDYPKVTVLAEIEPKSLASLRDEASKDVWLFGGGSLFRSLLEIDLVDAVEVAIVPILLGTGVPFLPATSHRRRLRLTSQNTYQKSGVVLLRYAVEKNGPQNR